MKGHSAAKLGLLASTALASCGAETAGRTGEIAVAPVRATDVNAADDVVEVRLAAEPGTVRYLPDGPADVWAYRDDANPSGRPSIPGPTIEAKQGDRVVVHFHNRLPEATTIHWHGLRVPNAADGTPSTQLEVASGQSFVYEFTAHDTGTFWYHPHMRSDVQIERGLYGLLVVRGGPDVPADADRAFVLDDVKLEASGRLSDKTDNLDLMLGRQGNVLLVNGQPLPTLRARSGARERWRFVNSANGRYFNLRLPGHAFTVIAWDGGLLPQPYETETLLITPGERYEVLVTLTGATGSGLQLQTIHYDRGHAIPDPGAKPLLEIDLGPEASSSATLPTVRSDMPALPTTSDTPVRRLELEEIEPAGPDEEPRFLINERAFPDVPAIEARAGEVEIWSVTNDTEMDHPFHLHGMFFQVLDVDGAPPDHPGWKDTVNIPQKKTLRFAVRYGTPGRWMFHCHILEHAERGMMGELVLGAKN